jgi:hypothetical protein
MPDVSPNTPQYWRERAEAARAMANHLTNPVARQHMMNCVAGYERLARMAEVQPIHRTATKSPTRVE